MPRAARKTCSGRGGTCPNLVEQGRSRCRRCGGSSVPRRRTASSVVYPDPRWPLLSRQVRLEEPICKIQIRCAGDRSEVADHIVEIEDGGAPFDRANLQGACRRCNTAKGQLAAQARRARQAS